MTLAEMACQFEVSPPTVHNWLRRASIPTRPSPATTRADVDDHDIASRYVTLHQTAAEIASALGCSQTLIYTRLDRLGIPRRSPEPRFSPRPPDNELRQLYEAEQCPVGAIAERFQVTPSAVYQWLRDTTIELRPGKSRDRIDPDELVGLYEAGASGPELARQYGCSTATIYRRLDDAGMKRRVNNAIDRGALIDALENGQTAPQIAATLDISISAVCRALTREGLQTTTQKKQASAREHYASILAIAERAGTGDPETLQYLRKRI